MNKRLKVFLGVCTLCVGVGAIGYIANSNKEGKDVEEMEIITCDYNYTITERTESNDTTEKVYVEFEGQLDKDSIKTIANEVLEEVSNDSEKENIKVFIYDANIEKKDSFDIPFKPVVYRYTATNNEITDVDELKDFSKQPTKEDYELFENALEEMDTIINKSEEDEIATYLDTLDEINWSKYNTTKEQAKETLNKVCLWVN